LYTDDEFIDWLRKRQRLPFLHHGSPEDRKRHFPAILREVLRDIPEALYRERQLPNGRTIREVCPIVYGYYVHTNGEGTPIIQEFGNVKPIIQPFDSGDQIPSFEKQGGREPLVNA
jgi:hypothetical protein